MRRKNEQAELMKRQTAETKRGSVYCPSRALPQRYLRVGAALLLALAVLLSFAPRTLAQETWQKKAISISVIKPLKEPVQYRSTAKEPRAQTELEFNGNGSDWSFVKFDQLPGQTTLKVRGNITGYDESESLVTGKWYPFKTLLPVILEIKPEAHMPVEFAFFFGSPNTYTLQELQKTPDLNARDLRRFADDNQVKQDTDRQTIRFSWNTSIREIDSVIGSQSATSTASPVESATPIPAPTPDNSWGTYIDDHLLFLVVILLLGLALLAVLGLVVFPIVRSSIRNRKRKPRPLSLPKEKKQASATTKPATETEMYDLLGGGASTSTNQETSTLLQTDDEPEHTSLPGVSVVAYRGDKQTPGSQKQHAQEEHARQPRAGDVIEPSPRAEGQAAPPASQDGKRLGELESLVQEIQDTLRNKVDRRENLSEAAQVNVKSMLDNSKKDILARIETMIQQSLTQAVKPMEDLMTEQASSVHTEFEKTANRITQLAGDGEQTRQQLTELLKELGQVEKRLQARLAEMQTALDRQAVPDSFYAKTLGSFLGQNVEILQDGNFEQMAQQIGERLNQFFQTGVARGEGLQELRARAEGINSALKDVTAQMTKLNPQVTDDAGPHMRRVEGLVNELSGLLNELSGLQAQLQNRRATVETKLRIPVSMHTGARQTFLDELGRGIKREIDKLNAPESYFEGELERLITADIIAIVDICDKKVAPPPGSRPELEAALKQLFEQAGLRPILPHQGEPFKTAEQDLIEMAQGGGQSLTVAQVITRGFYYKHRDNETLLRKAGVTVYR